VSTDTQLDRHLLAYLDAGIAPITAEEARGRCVAQAGNTSKHSSTRRSTLTISIGFALLLAVGVVAVVYTSDSRKVPTVGSGQGAAVRLAPDGYLTSAQLHAASSTVVRRLSLIGVNGVTASVSGGDIILTAKGAARELQTKVSSILAKGEMLFRPVLCAGPPYQAGPISETKSAGPGPLPVACPSRYQLTATNLDVNTNTGTPQGNVPPWPTLANYPSTASAMDSPAGTVLLPAGSLYGFSGERLLLGQAQLSGMDVSTAAVVSNAGYIVVGVDLTSTGSTAWDTLAMQQFHAYVALDFDATLMSAPLTEPTQASFSSFDGKVEVSGGFTKATAEALVVDLKSGPLPSAMRVVSTSKTRLTASS